MGAWSLPQTSALFPSRPVHEKSTVRQLDVSANTIFAATKKGKGPALLVLGAPLCGPIGINPTACVVIIIPEGDTVPAVTLGTLRQQREIAIGEVVHSWKPDQASELHKSRVAGRPDVGNVNAPRRKV